MSLGIVEVADDLGLRKEGKQGDEYLYYDPHDSDTPDLHINPSKNQWFTFAAGQNKGGGFIDLICHVRNCGREQAKDWLAENYPERFSEKSEEEINRQSEAREVIQKAVELSQDTLEKQKKALKNRFKENRGFDDEDLEEAGIGYLSQSDVDILQSRFDEQALIDSGVFTEVENGIYCHLKDRIIFPYYNADNPVYLAGRATSEDQEDKYRKSRTTEYNRHPLYQFRDGQDKLIITEGFTDTISAYKAGYDTVTPATVTFRDDDIQKMVNIAENYDTVYIANDADEAGEEGAEKTAQELTKAGTEPRIVELPEGMDFDDWTTENGYDIETILDQSEYYLDLLFQEIEDAHRNQKREVKKKIFELIASWDRGDQDEVLKDMPGSKRDNRAALNDYIEKHALSDEEKAAEKVDVDREADGDEEDEIQSKLRIHDQVLKINPVNSEIQINSVIETYTEELRNKQGVVKSTPQFKVLEFQIGKGEEQPTYKLLVSPYREIEKGDNALPIKQADLSKEIYQQYFREKYNKKVEKNEDFNIPFQDWMDSQHGKYYELADEISEESKNRLQKLSNDQILEAIEEYLCYGYELDSKLKQLMFPKLVQHDKTQVDPKEVMSFAPHSQMWTNTKVGKTFVADRVGRNQDDATPAGLVGYADTDGKQEGTLDGLTDPVFIDEFNFGSSSTQMNDKLLGVMERGIHDQSKAGYRIKTRTWSPLTYMANPRENQEDKDKDNLADLEKNSYQLVERFEELIEYLGYNIQAMGSRFGVILFDEEMKTASGEDIPSDRGEKLKTFLNWVKKEVAKEYSQIERELRQWLHKEYDDDYIDRVEELADQIHSDPVKKFWRNHVESYRHARGQALRMAVYQNIGDVLKDNYSVEELKKEAEQAFEDVKQINLESLENMADASDSETMKKRAKALIESEEPKYVKIFVQTVVSLGQQEDIEISEQYQPLSLVKDHFNEIKEDLVSVSENSTYWKWSKLRDRLVANKNKHGFRMEQRYGIKLIEVQDAPMMYVSKPERFDRFSDLKVANSEGCDQSDRGEVKSTNNEDCVHTGESDQSDQHLKFAREGSHSSNNTSAHNTDNNSSGPTSPRSHHTHSPQLITEEKQILRELKDYDFYIEAQSFIGMSSVDKAGIVLEDLKDKGLVEFESKNSKEYVKDSAKLQEIRSKGDLVL